MGKNVIWKYILHHIEINNDLLKLEDYFTSEKNQQECESGWNLYTIAVRVGIPKSEHVAFQEPKQALKLEQVFKQNN